MFDHEWTPLPVDTADGAVIVSQSCDASLPHRDRVQIAPVVRIEHPEDLREAASGKRTQFVALPRIGSDYFADLDAITTVFKTALLGCHRVAGVETDQEVREFAFSVSRRFGRFAYPDEVSECLIPLQKALQSKARKETSPLGRALTGVHSFRVACEDWTKPPYELTLIVILEPGLASMEFDDEGDGDAPRNLQPPSSGDLAKHVNNYAEYLLKEERTPTEKYYAWQYLAEAWALQCEAVAATKGLFGGFVDSVSAELAVVDDFPLSRVLSTESLDLDYLSDSRKSLE